MAGLVGLALTSCKEDNSLGTMQKNEAPIVVPADGVALQSLYSATGNRISLQNYEDTKDIPLVDIEISSSFPENSTVTGEVEISDNADFRNAQVVPLSAVQAASANENVAAAAAAGGETRSYKGVVSVSEWNSAFVSYYGLNPAANINYVRYRLWLSTEKQNVILYDENGNEWFDAMEFIVTPLDAKLDVAASYTLHYIVNGEEQTVVMYHNPDKHVYDDPNFNATVEATENEDGTINQISWWIAPTDDASKAYGVAGEDAEAETGDLALKSEGGINGIIAGAGVYKIEADMLDLTYSVKLAPPSLYVVSTSYIQFPQAAQLGTDDNIVYSGMAGIEAAWGLTGQAAFKPTLYSNNPDVEITSEGGTVTGGLIFDTTGAPLNSNTAIPLPGTRGLFYVTANLQTLQYTAYRCNSMGITGSMAGVEWGAGPDIELKNSRTTYYMTYTGTLTVNAGDEWKIRANGDWAVNFGGANGGSYTTDGQEIELSMGGDNFVAAEAGTYNITVYLRRYLENGKMVPYRMTVTPAN